MSGDNNYVVVGKIGTTYGIKGWLKIVSFTDPIAGILDYDTWHLEESNRWTPTQIEAGREYGKGIIVHFEGLDTPEEAKRLTGKRIAIQRSQLAVLEKHEYYWADLEGLTVINYDGTELGKVVYLMETGSNDVLVIHGEKDIAIPYLPDEVILDINLETKTMRVKWDLL